MERNESNPNKKILFLTFGDVGELSPKQAERDGSSKQLWGKGQSC